MKASTSDSASDWVTVREVGLRDGLQLVPSVLPTEDKLAWLQAEAGTGIRAFEVTSFVSATVMPQFADAEAMARQAPELVAGLGTPFDLAATVLNLRGAERALAAGMGTLIFVISASAAHSRGNARRSTEQALEEFAAVTARARAADHPAPVKVVGAIATAFGCTLEGEVDPARVHGIARAMAERGASEVAIADTVGYAHPAQVRRLCTEVKAEIGDLPLGAHFHDTRGLGLANTVAALEAGVRSFDASLGGLGGCPFAPGASGNVATEDLVHMLQAMGMSTGIDLEALLDVRRRLPDWLPGVSLYGALAKAGIPHHRIRS